ncbi:MAG TPA: hypothetical protein VE981_20260 [Planctomycetota bacterium]|nr:hypothetical protein [Planctomycetota bacterium]
MKPSKEPLLGWVRPVKRTEDRILYEYRTPRRLARGLLYVALAVGLIAFGFRMGVARANLLVWILAIVPLLLSGVFASWGLLDLITRGLFELEIDRRARTLALSMPTERGEALAKAGFEDVASVDVAEQRPLPGARGRVRWSITLAMRDSRRIGLGLTEDGAEADRLAAEFCGLLGVSSTRSVHESRGAD